MASFAKPVLVANLIEWPAGYYAARVSKAVLGLDRAHAVAVRAVLRHHARDRVPRGRGSDATAARTTPAEVLRQE